MYLNREHLIDLNGSLSDERQLKRNDGRQAYFSEPFWMSVTPSLFFRNNLKSNVHVCTRGTKGTQETVLSASHKISHPIGRFSSMKMQGRCIYQGTGVTFMFYSNRLRGTPMTAHSVFHSSHHLRIINSVIFIVLLFLDYNSE